ncbi:MAG: YfhO family protein, partial [Chloroflexi bacterium]|nr:YfhO family protein [Chloroflexota bacterium]
LARYSSRQGGLLVNEALSFSLHPLLLTRSLLPGYGQSLFSEYVAFLPLTGWLLVFVGAWRWRAEPVVRPFVVLAVVGFFLALGRFNPLSYLLVQLPGFDLFRAPARWLALFALGTALLAGVGWQRGQGGRGAEETRGGSLYERGGPEIRRLPLSLSPPLLVGTVFLVGLMVWGFVAVPLARWAPVGPEAPAEWPAALTVVGWVVELGLGGSLLFFDAKTPRRKEILNFASWRLGVGILALGALWLASRSLPYNGLTTPEAYFDLRPAVARLMAEAACGQPVLPTDGSCPQPPGRFLSLSEIFFDPGDQAEINSIYAGQLPAEALYDYTVAIKEKEIIAPNLPLAYELPAVDGFDGGILPLRSYTALTSLILPEGVETTDGRLREHLPAVPEGRWLDLFNVRYLVTDKVGDTWREIGEGQSAYFDLQHPATLAAGERLTVGYVPDFPATALVLIAEGQVGTVEVTAGNGKTWTIAPVAIDSGLLRAGWPEPGPRQVLPVAVAETVTLQAAGSGEWRIHGLTLVNERDGTFQSLVAGNYRLIHSGDVKIYENLDALPRAFLVYEWEYRPDVASSVEAMRASGFDPARTAVLVGDGPLPGDGPVTGGTAQVLNYEPERVVVQVESEAAGLLLLTDAWYPGWQATVDGQLAATYQADGLFRGVMVPAGEHEIIFSFTSSSFAAGRLLSLGGVIGWLLLVFAGNIPKVFDAKAQRRQG